MTRPESTIPKVGFIRIIAFLFLPDAVVPALYFR